MGTKKKLALGVASAALGLSLIGGGTFSWFNDTAVINNSLATGTIDLSVIKDSVYSAINFDLSNLKPGDHINREFRLDNIGSLAIQNVWMGITADQFVGLPGANLHGFLDQFEIDCFRITKDKNGTPISSEIRLFKEDVVTLGDLANARDLTNFVYQGTLNTAKDRVDLAAGGLSVDPNEQEYVRIYIKFKDNGNQNKYQATAAKIHFNLEATQYGGQKIETNDENGYIKQNEYKGGVVDHPEMDESGQSVSPVED